MMYEFKEIDKEGYVVESHVLEEMTGVPLNYRKVWDTNELFYVPRWDRATNKWVEGVDLQERLKDEKAMKLKQLGEDCQEAILGRFPSKHQGTDYSFSYDKEAQANFAERWNLFQNNMITSIMLTAKTIPGDEVKRIQVNKDEFTIIYLDSIKHKENCISRLQDLLMPMVNNAVTLKQLADIRWSNISVFPGEPSIEVKDDATLAKGVKNAEETAGLAKDSSDLTTTAFMEAMGLLFGGKM